MSLDRDNGRYKRPNPDQQRVSGTENRTPGEISSLLEAIRSAQNAGPRAPRPKRASRRQAGHFGR